MSDLTECYQEFKRQSDQMIQKGSLIIGKFSPFVCFGIPGVGLSLPRYRSLMRNLLREFLEQSDPRNRFDAEMAAIRAWDRPNEEGGLGGVYLEGFYVQHCKMYLFDGTSQSRLYNPKHNYKPWRGLLFRDHPDPNPEFQLAKVFLVADCFERFLCDKKVKFSRFNTPVR